ncbi:MAG TPA: PQQ-binding-like beta-propeller repeat protein [Actinomycetes bacterium]
MIAAATARRFPRGVAEPTATRAFVHDRAGRVLALDLATGVVLWRAGTALRPLAVVGEVVVTARVAPRSALEVVMLDAEDGQQLRVSNPLALPDWAQPSLDDTPDFTLRAETEDRAVLLYWAASAGYRGGAAPSTKVLAAAERQARGAARVQVDTGALEPLPEPAAALEHPDAPAAPVPDPEVLEQRDLGTNRFQLVARGGAGRSVQVLVRAVDRATGRTAWETVIDEEPRSRPRPLRP